MTWILRTISYWDSSLWTPMDSFSKSWECTKNKNVTLRTALEEKPWDPWGYSDLSTGDHSFPSLFIHIMTSTLFISLMVNNGSGHKFRNANVDGHRPFQLNHLKGCLFLIMAQLYPLSACDLPSTAWDWLPQQPPTNL